MEQLDLILAGQLLLLCCRRLPPPPRHVTVALPLLTPPFRSWRSLLLQRGRRYRRYRRNARWGAGARCAQDARAPPPAACPADLGTVRRKSRGASPARPRLPRPPLLSAVCSLTTPRATTPHPQPYPAAEYLSRPDYLLSCRTRTGREPRAGACPPAADQGDTGTVVLLIILRVSPWCS